MKNTGYDHHETILFKRASGYEKRPGGYVNAAYLDMSLPFAGMYPKNVIEDIPAHVLRQIREEIGNG